MSVHPDISLEEMRITMKNLWTANALTEAQIRYFLHVGAISTENLGVKAEQIEESQIQNILNFILRFFQGPNLN
jgi:hypothetical protein